jgi:hypothetical protein
MLNLNYDTINTEAQTLTEQIKKIARTWFNGANGSHDWEHTIRVAKLCEYIGAKENMEKVMKLRGKIPHGEWMMKLERVLLKEDPDADTSFESDEVLKLAPGSLAASGIDKVLTVKELIDSIINGAEEILKTGVFAAVRG